MATTTSHAPWPIRPLAECGRLLSGGTPSKATPEYWEGTIPWFSSKEIKSFDLRDSELHVSKQGAENGSHLVPAGSVLFVVRGMSLANEFRVGITLVTATFNQDVKAVIPTSDVDPRYLARCLRWLEPTVLQSTEESSHGTKRLSGQVFENLPIPVPPLEEQRYIADILDKADAIRRKRTEAVVLTGELLRSVFVDMFGDPVTNPKGWPTKPLVELLAAPLRNGLSPSTGGKFEAPVLTLSAITRGHFDASASKMGAFSVEPRNDVRVDSRDFLICRGNGNVSFVGKAAFPRESMSNTVFPDTMIAARVDHSRVLPAFLTTLWQSPFVRRQIEAGARTTNGTFKINQGVVESIVLLSPPLAMQQAFAEIGERVLHSSLGQQAALRESDDLFNSLVSRAFSGALSSAC